MIGTRIVDTITGAISTVLESTSNNGVNLNLNVDGAIEAKQQTDALTQSLTNLNTARQSSIKSIISQKAEQLKTNVATKASTVATVANTAVIKSMGVAAKVASVGMTTLKVVAGSLITAFATIAISKFIGYLYETSRQAEITAENAEALRAEIDNLNKELRDQQSFISDNASRYEELSEGVDNLGRNVSLTTEEYKEYNSIVNDIADMFPELVTGYTEEGNAILSVKGNVEALTEAYRENKKEKYQALLNPAEGEEGVDTLLADARNNLLSSQDFFGNTDLSAAEVIDYANKVVEASQKGTEALEKLWMETVQSSEHTEEIDAVFRQAGINSTVEIRELDSDELASFRQRVQSVLQQYQAELDQAIGNVEYTLDIYFNTNEHYDDLDKNFRAALSMYFSNLDTELALELSESPEAAGAYVNSTIEEFENNEKAKNALIELFTLDRSDMPLDEAVNTVNQLIDTIISATGESKESFINRFDESLGLNDLFQLDDNIDNEIIESVTYFRNKLSEELKKLEQDDGISLTIRPQIETSRLERAGWGEQEPGVETLYAQTYTNEEGTQSVVLTPILPDGTVLSPESLQAYANKILSGQKIDADIVVGMFDGDNAQQQAQTFVQRISQMLQDYFVIGSTGLNDTVSNFFEEQGIDSPDELAVWHDVREEIDDVNLAMDEYIRRMRESSETSIDPFSKSEMITEINSLSEGFESLDKIMNSIKDEDNPFDYALLDDSKFTEIFSGFEDEYTNFIETVSDSPKDINACQSAFDELLTAWLNSTDIINRLSDDTAQLTIDMLSNMGVANAEEVVMNALAAKHAALAAEKYYNANASRELRDATASEYVEFLNEANGANVSQMALAQLMLEKMAVNNTKIDTSSDVEQVINLANAAGASSEILQELARVKSVLASAESGELDMSVPGNNLVLANAQHRIEEMFTPGYDWNYQIDPNQFTSAVYGGGTKTNKGGGGSKNKEAEEIFDWMEEKIENLNEEIDKLTTKMEDAVGFRPKNTIADSIIAKLQEEADVYTQMIDRYNQQLNSIGLSDEYVDKIKNGLIDIETITDETLLNQIKDYQEWDDKLEDCETQLIEVRQRIEEMQYTKLDNVIDQYDILSSSIENCISTQEQLIDLMGQTGEEVTFENYESLISKQEKLAQQYANAYRDLSNEMSQLNLEQGSEEWEKYNSQLEEYKQNVISCTSAVEDYKDEIFELTFKVLDEFNSRIEEVNNTISVMHDLIGSEGLIDENGLSDRGIAQVALYAHELSNAQKQIVEYEEAMDALEEAYDSGLITQEEYNEALSEYRSGQEAAVQATKQAQDAILQIIKDGIQAQIDAKQEEIDATKEQLAAEKELNDYREGIVDKSEQIAVLEKQIATLSLSTDRADIAQRLELEEQLADLREELISDQEDHAYDEQVDALDEYLNAYTEEKEAEMDELDTNLDKQQSAINEYLEKVKNNYSTVYGILNQYGDAYSVSAIEDLTDPWSKSSEAADLCSEAIGNVCAEISYDIANIDMSPLYELVDLLSQINGFGGTGSSISYDDISGQGTWQKGQGGKWWYGEPYDENGDYWYADSGIYTIDGKQYSFDDNGYMQTEWVQDDDGTWRYFDANTGEMQKGIWIPGRNGEQYYLDKNGNMATNAAVKGENGQDYYYVDEDGVWDGKTLTYDEVKKLGLKVAYKKGTNNAKKGLALTDEEGLGSEVIITKYGALRQLNSGDHVFNADQVKTLYEMSSLTGLPNMLKDMEKNFANMGKNISYNNTGLTITSPLIQIDGTGMSSAEVAKLINSQINDLPTKIMKAIKYNLR